MDSDTHVAVVGSAIHAPRFARARSLEKAMYAVTQSALLDADLKIDDIDGIVVDFWHALENVEPATVGWE